jgi:hypothetical protein
MSAQSGRGRWERAWFEPGPSPSWLSHPERLLLLLLLVGLLWVAVRVAPLIFADFASAVAALARGGP